jgi:hypothetical protein
MQSTVGTQNALAGQVAAQDMQYAKTAFDRGNQMYQTYQDTALPALQKLKADADNYNEAGYQEQLAQGAAADISNSFEQQRRGTEMRQQAYGIDPTSGVAAGNAQSLGVQQALMGAQASNQVRQAAHELGLQKQANLYNAGTGILSQANTQTGLGLGASAQGFGTSQQTLANQGMLASALSGQAGTAMQGFGQAGNLAASISNSQRQAAATESAGYGQAIGAGLGMYAAFALSDATTKQDITLVGQLPNGVNVYEFEYKPAFRSKWGHGRKTGVLAHEVEHIPGAVLQHPAGYKLVNYGKVVSYGV